MFRMIQSYVDRAIPESLFKQEGLTLNELEFSLDKAAYSAQYRTAFAQDEIASVDVHLRKSTVKGRYEYDLKRRIILRQDNPGVTSVIALWSRNFGYEFALVKVRLFWHAWPSLIRPVTIYISLLGKDSYVPLGKLPGLRSALRSIDRHYCFAAKKHLP